MMMQTDRNNKTGESIDERKVITDTTSKVIRSDKRYNKQDMSFNDGSSHIKNVEGFPLNHWKQRDFLEEFSINQDVTSQRSDDINWSTSSSDESLPNELHKNSLKTESKPTILKKRKRHSPKVYMNAFCLLKTQSNQSSSVSEGVSCNLDKPRNINQSATSSPNSQSLISSHSECPSVQGESESTLESTFSTFAKNIEPDLHQKICRKPKDNLWSLSSFADLEQTTVAGTSLGKPTVARNSKLKRVRGDSLLSHKSQHLRSRNNRRLYTASQESFGEISDVESDTEIEDIVTSGEAIDSDDEVVLNNNSFSANRNSGHDALHVHEEGTKCSQIDISSGTSSSQSSSVHSEKIRASDWVKALQKHKTPEKENQTKNVNEDSSKKKQKFARGSLADQLIRVVNRERTSVRLWYHSVQRDAFDEKINKCLLIKLLSMKKQFSVFICKCLLMSKPVTDVPCKVVFMRDTVEKLSLKSDMTVQIFAPWQHLEESDGVRTILCTHFVRVVSNCNPELSIHEVNKNEKCIISASVNWSCPCSKDFHLSPHVCPAVLCPVVPHQSSQVMRCAGSSDLPSATLTVTSTVLQEPSITSVPKRTLLKSLEEMSTDSSLLPPFSALVLRVFRHRIKGTSKHRFQLLVEDLAGTLAIVSLLDDCGDTQKAICQVGFTTCTFSCLHVISRTNRDRDPSLFRIVDQVWTRQFLPTCIASQQSGSDGSQIQLPTTVPSFAYVLHSTSDMNCSFSVEQDGTVLETSIKLMTLKQIVQCEDKTRVSFLARVCLPPRFSQVTESVIVFVYDSSSVDAGGRTSAQRVEIGDKCVVTNTETGVYLFRDVLLQNGHLQCDSYTLVLEMSVWTMWGVHDKIDSSLVDSVTSCLIKLAPVCYLSEPGQLFSVEGSISEIDENLAYSWEECEYCDSDQLATSEESGMTYCTGCNRHVMSPVVRTRLEVYVTCTSSPTDLVVKLDLTEKTIESLLPTESNEEGYDTEQVVGKYISCPACLVHSRVSTDTGNNHTVSLVLTELQC